MAKQKINQENEMHKVSMVSCVSVDHEFGASKVAVGVTPMQEVTQEQYKRLIDYTARGAGFRGELEYFVVEGVSSQKVLGYVQKGRLADEEARLRAEQARKTEEARRAKQEQARKLKRLKKLEALAQK